MPPYSLYTQYTYLLLTNHLPNKNYHLALKQNTNYRRQKQH